MSPRSLPTIWVHWDKGSTCGSKRSQRWTVWQDLLLHQLGTGSAGGMNLLGPWPTQTLTPNKANMQCQFTKQTQTHEALILKTWHWDKSFLFLEISIHLHSTKFDTTITDFQRKEKILIPYKPNLPRSTCIKIFRPWKTFSHEPFSPARLESNCWAPEIFPNLFMFLLKCSPTARSNLNRLLLSGKFCP